jgi:hypothetical protein
MPDYRILPLVPECLGRDGYQVEASGTEGRFDVLAIVLISAVRP